MGVASADASHLDVVITVLSITAHALALGLLALAVVLLHEALGVLAGVDGDGAELPVLDLPRPGGLAHVTHGAGGQDGGVGGGGAGHVVHRVGEVPVVRHCGGPGQGKPPPSTNDGPSNSTLVPWRNETLLETPATNLGLKRDRDELQVLL